MNWKLAFAGTLAGALLTIAAQQALAEDVVIKVWSRADRSGPLRAGNLVSAGDTLNKMLAAINSDKRVKIELNETNAKGYDDDALDLLKAWNTGHGGGICTLHANSALGALARLEDLIHEVVPVVPRRLLLQAIDLIAYLERDVMGQRHLTQLAELKGSSEDGYLLRDIPPEA